MQIYKKSWETQEQYQHRIKLTLRIKYKIPSMVDESCISIASCICNKRLLNIVYPHKEELALRRIIELLK